VIVVLPAYNEEHHIAPLLEAIAGVMGQEPLGYEVVVVDDGSSDGTFSRIEQQRERIPLHVCRHSINQGLGATILDGLKMASSIAGDDDVVVTMDCDETHSPSLIPSMVRMIGGGCDVVIASRYRGGARVIGLSLFRRMLSFGASMLFRLALPVRGVRDYTCGYRAYRGAVLRKAIATYGDSFVAASGFECMLDMLLKLSTMNVMFGEVPFVLRYDLKRGASKLRVARTILRSLALLVRYRLQGWTSRSR
jgi:dolichol-phosphate mannosyltransferase